MKIFSSIPPRHANGMAYIQQCVHSWQKWGEVYSVNHPEEIEQIRDLFPDVKFLPTFQTQRSLTGKPLVTLDAIFNEIRFYHDGKSMFINSDCLIHTDNLEKYFQEDRFVYLHRINYDEVLEAGSIYKMGVDAFLFTNIGVLNSIQATHFCVGQCYFDLYYPFAIGMAGMEICTTEDKVIYHKNHPEQYKNEDWYRFGEYTALIIGKKLHKPAQVSEFLYHFLKNITVKI